MTDTTPTISGEASFPTVAFGNNAALNQLNAAPTALPGTFTPSEVESETPCRVNQLLVGLRRISASRPCQHQARESPRCGPTWHGDLVILRAPCKALADGIA
jgi:hypothetical protein